MNDGALAVKHLFLLLKLHLCLDLKSRGGAYTQSIIMQLLIVMYQKKKNLPQWQMLHTELSVFNEEAGEITFSQLARASVGDTQKRKFDHMDRLYKLLHIYGEVEQDQLDDVGSNAKPTSSRSKIDPQGEGVMAVAAYMNSKIRELKTQSFLEYDGKKASWISREHALHQMKPIGARKPFWQDDMLETLHANIKKAKKKFHKTDWAGEYSNIWPECAVPVNAMEHASDSDIFEGKDSDADGKVDPDYENDENQDSDSAGREDQHSASEPEDARYASDAVNSDGDQDPDDEKHDKTLAITPNESYERKQAINPDSFAVGSSANLLQHAPRERSNRSKRKPDNAFPMVTVFYKGMNRYAAKPSKSTL
jgi:hypothetical protein